MGTTQLRCWRTGAAAVVMAGLGEASLAAWPAQAQARPHSCRPSPFDVHDTATRIEGSAQRRGMSVFARSLRGADSRFIVLASAQGGTPVLMRGGAAERIELPLSVLVRLGARGRAEVLSAAGANWTEMPLALAEDLAQLDAALGEALRAA
jgi:hypothetical protein